MRLPTIEARSLCKSFGPVRANHNISFSVNAGELLCLFGENGAGKSTLSACLTGLFPPDAGEILFKGEPLRMASAADAIRKGIGLVHQHFVLVPDFTVLENIVIGSEKGFNVQYVEAEKKLRRICDNYGIGIDPNAWVRDLSVGERQWAELLKALYFDADVLILDEPTATLDVENSKKLFRIIDKLKSDGVALILITHFLDEVMQSDRVAVLRQGELVGIRKTAETTPEELTRMMVGRDLEPIIRERTPVGPDRLVLENVTVIGVGQVPDLDNVSLTVRQGEIFGIAGVAGNGQNPLMEVIAGVRTLAKGRISLDGKDIGGLNARVIKDIGLGHIPDDRFVEGLVSEMSIEENLILGDQRGQFASKLFLDFPKMQRNAVQMIREFQISAPSGETKAGDLSGGNAQRVILAREMRLASKVLLANQPTRGLDVGVIEYIHSRLLEKRADGVAVLIASSELEDLLNLCDRIGVLFQGRLMGIVETEKTNLEEIGLLMAGKVKEDAA
ncbi:ABC transporter ATP-binding protein [Candidatus Halocynthiibacter alkanivorans]|uniref:ABC transporter ATP-binding protein n=1 Tax=Candidatus Halocynthiibacter alkanivorans TaxID=2267619 RepID=UPI000DF45543|nr:ABC transporter ATP-binding protein [Candidatus Halocynthiibacter alkanivorans]